MKFVFIFLFFITASVYSQEQDTRTKQKFNIPATEFVDSGFKISLSGAANASQSNAGGPRNVYEASFLNYILTRNGALLNTGSGQLQRDNILTENIESYSYMNQPYEKISPLGRIGFSYTTKSGEWTFDIAFRAKNYSGSYVLGNNSPFEYYPGTMQYNWREGQYAVMRNHPITNFFMIQPQIGIREITEKYNRNSDVLSYPLAKNYSFVSETTRNYSAQSGLTLHFKILDSLRIKLTGKIFQALTGDVRSQRADYRYDGISNYGRIINSRLSRVVTYGNEIEGEINYNIKMINLFLGYNLTTIAKEARRDPNAMPIITTNENLTNEYLKYFLYDYVYSLSNYTSETQAANSRNQILKYFYFGASITF